MRREPTATLGFFGSIVCVLRSTWNASQSWFWWPLASTMCTPVTVWSLAPSFAVVVENRRM
ncbi:hypothetical protein CGQ36_12830 [Nocardiopsis dassonvillei]|nr:hypothetical protein CGQ36_12830 [Nocardiopsis dassonvillei]